MFLSPQALLSGQVLIPLRLSCAPRPVGVLGARTVLPGRIGDGWCGSGYNQGRGGGRDDESGGGSELVEGELLPLDGNVGRRGEGKGSRLVGDELLLLLSDERD